jgi:DNA polymerase-3 subunit delta'
MSFKDIVGQDRAIKILQSAIRNNRLSHAYLFVGPDGVGKGLTAKTLAKALNCENGNMDSCDECRHCRRIDLDEHPDVRVIEPTGTSIKIEEVRRIRREVALKPLESKKKVYIIHRTPATTPPAANALLKTLEEPQGETVFILLTFDIHKVLATIRSRCQVVRFRSLTPPLIETILIKKLRLAKDEAHMASNLAEGSLGDALSMVDPKAKELRSQIIDLLQTISLHDSERIFNLSRQFARDKESIPFILNVISSWYRDLCLLRETGDSSFLVNIDRKEAIREETKKYPAGKIDEILSSVANTINYIKRNVNPQLAIETLLVKIGGMKSD